MKAGGLGTGLLNFILFQAGWFACVLGAASGRPWMGAGIGAALALTHLALSRSPRDEAMLLAGALALGVLVDTAHVRMGTLAFTGGMVHPEFAPPWILVMWVQFASTLHYSLGWLERRYVLGACLGAVAGAGAYWAGVRLGAADFGPDTAQALLRIALSWGVSLPVLLRLALGTGRGREETYRVF